MYFSRVLLSFLVPTVVVVAIVVPLATVCTSNRLSADDRVVPSMNRSDNIRSGRGSDAPPNPSQLSTQEYLREGTMVLPTTGRLAMLGRRWVFIPNEKEDRNVNENERLISRGETPDMQSFDQSHAITLVENLVLQRMINAIRADSNDHTWTITAKVTEFFDENRLLLLTAQRANAR